MSFAELQPYVLPAVLAAFFGGRFLKFRRVRGRIPALISQGAIVLDVRTREEYAAGAREGSLNIPLAELESGFTKLDPSKPVIVCCASGMRSGIAAKTLKRKGFQNVVNAGPWTHTVVQS